MFVSCTLKKNLSDLIRNRDLLNTRVDLEFIVVLIMCFATVFSVSTEGLFLSHLSRKLKWAFLIKICPLSVVVDGVVVVVVVVVNFSHFHLLLQNHY